MERTRFPEKHKGNIKRITLDEIIEFLTDSEKTKLLKSQTELHGEIINVKRSIYHMGELLYGAKQILSHGKFIPWIKLTFGEDLPYSTAYFYMNVYERFKDDPKAIQFIPTKYLLMITQKEFPEEVLKTLKENHNKINKQGLQQIKEVYTEFKSGTIDNSQMLKLSDDIVKLGIDIWKGKTKHQLNTNMRKPLYYGVGNVLKRLDSWIDTARETAGLFPYDPNSVEHIEFIKNVDKTIEGLQRLKLESEGGKGFFKQISTPSGDEYV